MPEEMKHLFDGAIVFLIVLAGALMYLAPKRIVKKAATWVSAMGWVAFLVGLFLLIYLAFAEEELMSPDAAVMYREWGRHIAIFGVVLTYLGEALRRHAKS